MADETESFHDQLAAVSKNLTSPVEDETDLEPKFPPWANTRFESGTHSLTPRGLLLHVPDEYPYEDVDERWPR